MKTLAFLALAASASAAAGGDPATAAKAVNELGVELHQRLASKANENLCVSPYSIQTALAMTFAGAEGKTREEMAKVLHFGGDEAIHGSFAALQQALAKVGTSTAARAKRAKDSGGAGEPFTLNVANHLFGQAGYAFRAPFRTFLKGTYGAPLEELNFAKAPEAARKHINSWVEEQTRKRIRDLIPPGIIDEEMRLVLVNAVYMKAPWEEPFVKDATRPEPFHIRGEEAKPVPTMQQTKPFGYAKRNGYTAVAIPYFGREVQFLVLVPEQRDGLAALEKHLSAAELSDCAKLEAREVELHLPKFKMELPSILLSKELQALGLKTAFNEPAGSANFDRIAPRQPNDYLYISEVIHKTFIEVDEKGTEAAAATAVLMPRATSIPTEPPKPVQVKVDRPFVFAIQHLPSGACLFLGRVVEPR